VTRSPSFNAFVRDRQARRRDPPPPVDARPSRRRRADRRRRPAHHEPVARRPAGLLPRDRRAVRQSSSERAELASFRPLVQEEPATTRWFGIRFGPSSFGIFDAFPDESGRQAHLSGKVAQALGENTGELFDPPTIEHVDVLAEKPPV
jgi:hypothetical protein